MNERLKRPQLSVITGILKLLAVFAGVLIIVVVVSALWGMLFPGWAKYIAFFLFAVICAFVILKLLTEYAYIIEGNRLIIERYVFKRPKRIVSAELSEISYIGRYLPRSFSGITVKATYKSGKAGVVYIIYHSGGNKKSAVLSPSKRMYDLLISCKKS